MMFRVAITAMMLAAVVAMAPQAVALPILSLSSPNSLTNVPVGSTVRIDVTLSGLPSPNTTDFIFVMNSRELFPSASFQAPRPR